MITVKEIIQTMEVLLAAATENRDQAVIELEQGRVFMHYVRGGIAHGLVTAIEALGGLVERHTDSEKLQNMADDLYAKAVALGTSAYREGAENDDDDDDDDAEAVDTE